MSTKIEWTDETVNPVTGCTPISEGCANCYAKRAAYGPRLRGKFGYPQDDPFRPGTLHADKLDAISKLASARKAKKFFICSMGDLFHEAVPTVYIHELIYSLCKTNISRKKAGKTKHIWQLLTKRSSRMAAIFNDLLVGQGYYPNVWTGITVENQKRYDERIEDFLYFRAAVKFLSIEPMLGPIEIPEEDLKRIDWVIVGGETGPGARPMRLEWASDVLKQCRSVGVPFFYKGRGTHDIGKKVPGYRWLEGTEWNQFPNNGMKGD